MAGRWAGEALNAGNCYDMHRCMMLLLYDKKVSWVVDASAPCISGMDGVGEGLFKY